MTTFLIISFGILYAYLSYRKSAWALAALVFLLPVYQIRFSTWFVPMTLLELMILVLFAAWLVKTIYKKKKIIWGQYIWLVFLWLAVALLSAVVSPNQLRALGVWKAYFFEATLVYLLIINICKNKKALDLILHSLFLGAFIMSVFAIIQRFTGWLVPHQYWYLGEGQRVTGFLGVPNFLGLYLGPVVGLLLGKIFFGEWKLDFKKVFYILTLVLAFLAVVFAKSEGAIVAIICAVFFLGLLNRKTRVVTAVITLIGMVSYFVSPAVRSAILARINPAQNWSVFIRTQIWKESWLMLKDNWLLGAGLAGYQQAIVHYHTAEYFEIFLYPHNIFMNFWSEMGLAGLMLFIILMGKFFIDGFKMIWQKVKLEYVWGVILAMLIIIIHGLVDHPYFKNDLAVIFWMIFAILAVIKIDKKKVIN